MKIRNFIILLLLLTSLFGSNNLYACSTFMLKNNNNMIIGHNLDNSRDLPGMIVVNKRNITKTNISWSELVSNTKPSTPSIMWTSIYGSITFNPLGKEFPDGGINEAGLYIQEMSLRNSAFPEDEIRPKMFMMQWMQYQLDNYATVKQVIENISDINPDGWGWHFMVCDKNGNSAAIEFIDGTVKIYNAQIPVLCNSPYPEELESLKAYKPFGGDKTVDLKAKNASRFVHAAYMLNMYDPTIEVIDYGFEILEGLNRGGTNWSYIIDVKNSEVHFRTSVGTEIKQFNFSHFNFSCETPAKIIDINCSIKGEVTGKFQPYSNELNHKFVKLGIEGINTDGAVTKDVESQDNTLDQFISSMSKYPESIICKKN